VGDAAGVAYSKEALYAADLPARSVYTVALPVPGTDTRVLTGRGPLVAVGLISATGVVIGSIIGTGGGMASAGSRTATAPVRHCREGRLKASGVTRWRPVPVTSQ
jgi:hypothetical protein